mmetsp:Transcript_148285/g.284155  ORF Transcript_148285/g.284155 Transcript_148285/m.284155 type:complete len:166 (+) Transcript_148285:1786-2283(+)
MSGALFGSLPTSTPEPFTVSVVNGPCQAYSVVGADVRKLPPRLFDNVREYLMRSTTWRLERLKSSRTFEVKVDESVPERLSNWASTHIGKCLLDGGKLHTHKKIELDNYYSQKNQPRPHRDFLFSSPASVVAHKEPPHSLQGAALLEPLWVNEALPSPRVIASLY